MHSHWFCSQGCKDEHVKHNPESAYEYDQYLLQSNTLEVKDEIRHTIPQAEAQIKSNDSSGSNSPIPRDLDEAEVDLDMNIDDI